MIYLSNHLVHGTPDSRACARPDASVEGKVGMVASRLGRKDTNGAKRHTFLGGFIFGSGVRGKMIDRRRNQQGVFRFHAPCIGGAFRS